MVSISVIVHSFIHSFVLLFSFFSSSTFSDDVVYLNACGYDNFLVLNIRRERREDHVSFDKRRCGT